MAPYIFMERNGIHIIDLYKTAAKVDEAADALKNIAAGKGRILFVATKKQAKQIVAEKASSVGMPYVIERWPGGMLTNFPTIRKAIKKMSTIDKMSKDGTFDNLSKREKLQITRQRAKLEKMLGSIAEGVQGLLNDELQDGGGEIVGQFAAIDRDLARSFADIHACDGGFTPSDCIYCFHEFFS